MAFSDPATSPLLDRLRAPEPLVSVELRPPRADLSRAASMDGWIDMQHTARRLARRDALLFLTDNAVGAAEEENLRHLAANLAHEIPAAQVIPFLTAKHPLEYCLLYAARAHGHGHHALTVLGGDRTVGPPRCVEHGYELREMIRERVPALALGGWANPHRDPTDQVEYLMAERATAEFYLTQIVSHHDLGPVEHFTAEAKRRGLDLPAVFGVFFYRSANPGTLTRLSRFLPVPAEGVTRDFASGRSPEEICAQSIRALREVGARHVYVANLGIRRAARRYERILDLVG